MKNRRNPPVIIYSDTANSTGGLWLKTTNDWTNIIEVLRLNVLAGNRTLTISDDATVSGINTGDQDLTGLGEESTEVVTTTTDIEPRTNYISNSSGSRLQFNLPSTMELGKKFSIVGFGSAGWSITQKAGQTIHFGNITTSTGVAGSLASTDRGDAITIICVVENSDFVVVSSIGSITYV